MTTWIAQGQALDRGGNTQKQWLSCKLIPIDPPQMLPPGWYYAVVSQDLQGAEMAAIKRHLELTG